jgi:hypothetical protein
MIVNELCLDVRRLGGIIVVLPSGRLDVGTYAAFRDGLLKLAADEPDAIVVRLGAEFAVARPSMLAVFATVWMRVSEWPGVPIVVVPETTRHQSDVRRCGVSRFVPAYSSMRAAVQSVGYPPAYRRDVVELPCDLSAPRMARTFVRRACARWGVPLITDDAVLVASELTENAVRHAGSSSVLRLELRPGALAVAARDRNPRPPERQASGRGIDLVDRVCRTWGWSPSFDGGKVVWAVLAVP